MPESNAVACSVFRSDLRAATNAAHERLHRNADFAALLRGDIALENYRNLMSRLLGLHAPIEHRLAEHVRTPWLSWYSASGPNGRSHRLGLDLVALGMSEAAVASLPMADALLPALDDPAAALGCAWVVEGSALGGRVMARHAADLTSRLLLPASAFFAPDPDQPSRWRACCAALDACAADPVRQAAMLQTATATFAAFEIWLGETA